jgi:hypothetical protein
VSSPKPIKAAQWEVVDDTVLPMRVKVFPTAAGTYPFVVLGGIRLRCSLQEWRDINEAVELGFTNLTHRPVPARTDSVKPGAA